jgi:hypothetical protein
VIEPSRGQCLLEIREAMKMNKPIVLLELTGPGQRFSFDDAYALINDLEGLMPARNPYCLDELRKHLGEMSLLEFQQILHAALEQGRAMSIRTSSLTSPAPRPLPLLWQARWLTSSS